MYNENLCNATVKKARATGKQRTLGINMKFPYQPKAYTKDIEDYTYKHDITLKGEN